MSVLVVLVAAFVLLWLFVLLPQRRRQAAHAGLVAALEPGDEVLTAGGIYGEVRALRGDEVEVEVAPGVRVRVALRAIAAVLPPEPGVEDGAANAERRTGG
ncbi:MAG: preprotein translocase subunit YajC [Actinobacteria bacterium]|nr:preprotein translocase subunit YajC [Actinomycetota bacterium]